MIRCGMRCHPTHTTKMSKAWGSRQVSGRTPERTPGNFTHSRPKVNFTGSPLKCLYAADSCGVNRKNWRQAHTCRAITLLVSLKHGAAAPMECWKGRIQVAQFSFLLKRGNNYFSCFQQMSQQKTTILTLLISLSILSLLTSDRKAK